MDVKQHDIQDDKELDASTKAASSNPSAVASNREKVKKKICIWETKGIVCPFATHCRHAHKKLIVHSSELQDFKDEFRSKLYALLNDPRYTKCKPGCKGLPHQGYQEPLCFGCKEKFKPDELLKRRQEYNFYSDDAKQRKPVHCSKNGKSYVWHVHELWKMMERGLAVCTYNPDIHTQYQLWKIVKSKPDHIEIFMEKQQCAKQQSAINPKKFLDSGYVLWLSDVQGPTSCNYSHQHNDDGSPIQPMCSERIQSLVALFEQYNQIIDDQHLYYYY